MNRVTPPNPTTYRLRQLDPRASSFWKQKTIIACGFGMLAWFYMRNYSLNYTGVFYWGHDKYVIKKMQIIKQEEDDGLRPARFRMHASGTKYVYGLDDEEDIGMAGQSF